MSNDSHPASFATTCWSDVRRAAALDGSASQALEQLCRQYWFPLYAFLRRAGHRPVEAEDHVQSFFADLLSRESLRKADPSRGRFRTFLLTACKNHVSNRQRSEQAAKRGGGQKPLSFDVDQGELRYAVEPTEHWTAEKLFQRQWALSVIDAAFAQVRLQYEAKGRCDRFDALRPLVAPSTSGPSIEEVARQLGCSVGAAKVAAHRLRQQFGDTIREEIARTLEAQPGESLEQAVEEELGLLLAALTGQ